MRMSMLLAVLLRIGAGGGGSSAGGTGGHVAAVDVLRSMGAKLAEMPDPESLLFMGTALCCGAALCVYRAARAKRAGAKQVHFSTESMIA